MQLRDLFNEGVDHSPQTAALLDASLDVMTDGLRAEQLLLRASEAHPEQLATRVALYKLYAYTNRLDESLRLIEQVLDAAARGGGFINDPASLDPEQAGWNPATGMERTYLYTLKAKGFVLLRQGEVQRAQALLETLTTRLDPHDQVGGSVVLAIAQGVLGDEDEHEEEVA